MKNPIFYIGFAAILFSSACSEDKLDDVNTNPNAASAANLNPNYLLSDAQLERRLEAMSARLQTVPGTVKAADLIERLARTGEPVLR